MYSCDDVELAISLLTRKLSDILDVMAPVKVVQNRKCYAPWLSVNTKELIKVRNEALEKAHSTNDNED